MFKHNILFACEAFALLFTACKPPVQENIPLSEKDMADIRSVFETHKNNALASDWAADTPLYTKNAVKFHPSLEAIRGRAVIQADLETIDTVEDYTLNFTEIEGRGDLAYVWLEFSLTSVLRGSTESIVATGKALIILLKQRDGSWMFHRIMHN